MLASHRTIVWRPWYEPAQLFFSLSSLRSFAQYPDPHAKNMLPRKSIHSQGVKTPCPGPKRNQTLKTRYGSIASPNPVNSLSFEADIPSKRPLVMACAPKQRIKSSVVRLTMTYGAVRLNWMTDEGCMRHLPPSALSCKDVYCIFPTMPPFQNNWRPLQFVSGELFLFSVVLPCRSRSIGLIECVLFYRSVSISVDFVIKINSTWVRTNLYAITVTAFEWNFWLRHSPPWLAHSRNIVPRADFRLKTTSIWETRRHLNMCSFCQSRAMSWLAVLSYHMVTFINVDEKSGSTSFSYESNFLRGGMARNRYQT